MAYCPKCGVRVEEDDRPCPLCRFPVPKVSDETYEPERQFPKAQTLESNTIRRMINRIFVFISMLMLVAISMVFYINYELDGTFTWSKTAALSLVAGWGFLYLVFGYVKRYYNIILIAATLALALSFGIDFLSGGLDWFFPLAFPIIVGTAVVGLSYMSLIRSQFVSGFNIMGFFFMAMIILLMWINLFIGSHQGDINVLRWLIVTGLQLIPIGLIMLYIKYGLPERIKKRLAKKFHL